MRKSNQFNGVDENERVDGYLLGGDKLDDDGNDYDDDDKEKYHLQGDQLFVINAEVADAGHFRLNPNTGGQLCPIFLN